MTLATPERPADQSAEPPFIGGIVDWRTLSKDHKRRMRRKDHATEKPKAAETSAILDQAGFSEDEQTADAECASGNSCCCNTPSVGSNPEPNVCSNASNMTQAFQDLHTRRSKWA